MLKRTVNRQSTAQPGQRDSCSLIEIDTWIPSELGFIAPVINGIVRLVEESQCAVGNEGAIELALQEALNNAFIHGNGRDSSKQIRIRCRCEQNEGVSLIVTDQGQGFDPNTVPDPLLPERLLADHGRGVHFMRALMDDVHFERGGTEVHLRKRPRRMLGLLVSHCPLKFSVVEKTKEATC